MFRYAKDMRALRRFVHLRRDFRLRARADFLRAFSERHIAVPVSSPVAGGARIMVRYATLVVAFMFALNGGAVVLADSQNVAPNHPLYPYKRLGENIQLSVAPAASRPALRSKFAERRLEEIKEVAEGKTEGNEVEVLNSDFKNEINAALASADTTRGISTSTRMSLCGSLEKLITEHDTFMHKKGVGRWNEFAVHCKEFSGTDTFPVEEE